MTQIVIAILQSVADGSVTEFHYSVTHLPFLVNLFFVLSFEIYFCSPNLKTTQIILEVDSSKIDKNKIVFDYDFYKIYVRPPDLVFVNQMIVNQLVQTKMSDICTKTGYATSITHFS